MRGRSGVLALIAIVLAASVGSAASGGFHGSIAPLSPALAKQMTGVSWRAGCPVALRDLRVVTVTLRGFDGRDRTGRLIVHRDVAGRVLVVLRRLYAQGFPIRRMVPVDAYGGSDYRSIEADNTSAFNCRYVDGTTRYSQHAYGRAIDVNPIENPYVTSAGTTSHPASSRTCAGRRSALEWPSRGMRSCGRSTRSDGAGAAAGRAPRTTSTSLRPAAEAPSGSARLICLSRGETLPFEAVVAGRVVAKEHAGFPAEIACPRSR